MRKLRRDLPSARKIYRTGISDLELGLAHHNASLVPDTTNLPQNNHTFRSENTKEQHDLTGPFCTSRREREFTTARVCDLEFIGAEDCA
jgi:hypothetical protein